MTNKRLIDLASTNPRHEQKLLDEFRTAAFGSECRTISFLRAETPSWHEKLWMEASQEVGGTWAVTSHRTKVGAAPDDAIEVIVADSGVSFFNAIEALSEFERTSLLLGHAPSGEDDAESLGNLHYKAFGMREAIAFDDITGQAFQTQQGKPLVTGTFTGTMLRAVKHAFEEKSRLFILPGIDLAKKLGKPKHDFSLQEVKDILKNRESYPAFVNQFEEYIKLYKKAAKGGFDDNHVIQAVKQAHDALEERIELFPAGKWPDKQSLQLLLANTHVYFTLQQLHGRFQTALKQDRSSQFIEDEVSPQLETLTNYYTRVAKKNIPSIGRMLEVIMSKDCMIQGHPPQEIMEHFTVMKARAEDLKAGIIIKEAELPPILDIDHYVPETAQMKDIRGNIEKIKQAEKIAQFARAFDRMLIKYQDYLSGGLKDKYVHKELTEAQDEAEKLAIACPENNIIDRSHLIKLTVTTWVSAELKRLKAQEGEVTPTVKQRIETLGNYYERIMTENVPSYTKSRDFRKKFIAQSEAYIADVGTKVPAVIERELTEERDKMMAFVEEFQSTGLSAARNVSAPKPR